jgi:hypothetical protein
MRGCPSPSNISAAPLTQVTTMGMAATVRPGCWLFVSGESGIDRGRNSGLDFSERDRAVLALLRPHLYQAFLDAERRRNPVPGSPPAM